MSLLPVRNPGESAEDFLDRLMPSLAGGTGGGVDGGSVNGSSIVGSTIYDNQGRVVVDGSGLYVYAADGSIPVAADIVQIDTQHIVDAAIATNHLQDDCVDATKLVKTQALITASAQIGNGVIVTAAIGDAQITTAKIDNLAVNDAKIANASVGKLTAGTIGVNAIYVGNNRIEIDGLNGRFVIKDAQATPVTRVELGALIGGGNGIVIRAANGNVILSSGSTSTISGTFIDSITANQISTTTLAAISANLGTVTAGSIQSGFVTVGAAGQVKLDGASNLISVTDSGSTVRVKVGNIGVGYGIQIMDATGTVILQSGTSTFIKGAAIDSLSVSKLAAGNITATGVYVGSAGQVALNGASNQITISDGARNRIILGNTGTSYGLVIVDHLGNTVLQSTGTSTIIKGAFIDSVAASQISATTLSAIVADLGVVTAGTIGAGSVSVGTGNVSTGAKVTLDGVNNRITVSDGARNRVIVGSNGGVYGITLYDASGNVVLSSGSSTTISGTFIDSLAASKISVGTLTGHTIQTGTSGQRIVVNPSGGGQIEFYDASSMVGVVGVGNTGVGGGMVSFTRGSLNPTAYFENTSTGNGGTFKNSGTGTALQVLGTGTANGGTSYALTVASANNSTGAAAAFIASDLAASNGHGLRGRGGGNTAGVATGGQGLVGVGIGAVATNPPAFYCERGGIYLNSNTVTSFTGAHEALVPKGLDVEVGDVMVDVEMVRRRNVNDAIATAALPSEPYSKMAFGVFSSRRAFDASKRLSVPSGLIDDATDEPSAEAAAYEGTHDVAILNALGEGLINVSAEGGDIEAGDLLVTSSIPGKAKKQDDDLVRGYTVARAREAVTFASPTEVRQIACIYLCG